MRAPPKVKHFVWGCCSNAIPVNFQLKRRKLLEDSTCFRCGDGDETLFHCLFSCPYARQIWALSNLPCSSYFSTVSDIETWFNRVRSRLDSNEFGYFGTLCWWIWFSRNKLLWEAIDLYPLALVTYVQKFFEIFLATRSRNTTRPAVQAPSRWTPPPSDHIKLNMDAAVSDNGTAIGFAGRIPLPFNPECAEAVAALRATRFGAEAGWPRIIIEGDCLNVINGILDRDFSLGNLGLIFEEIKLLGKNFSSFQASHTHRENNSAAHSSAKLA
ncbi:hypothetical protein ACJIZ3_002480 [Penstemon smallii]|uniref:RNase H type-1 domain-containing protein n=1 Tax=Penstemon smallii TaxID=265156 RepID=A0ABD3U9T5_9LAMI